MNVLQMTTTVMTTLPVPTRWAASDAHAYLGLLEMDSNVFNWCLVVSKHIIVSTYLSSAYVCI